MTLHYKALVETRQRHGQAPNHNPARAQILVAAAEKKVFFPGRLQ